MIVKNVETGAERSLTSDESGRYSTPSVPVGRYEIAASKRQFQIAEPRPESNWWLGSIHSGLHAASGDVKQTVTVAEDVARQ